MVFLLKRLIIQLTPHGISKFSYFDNNGNIIKPNGEKHI